MVLLLVKNSRPDIIGAISKHFKVNDGENLAAFKELLCVIGYVLDTKNICLKLEPTRNANKLWKVVCSSDSDNVENPSNKRCVSGLI